MPNKIIWTESKTVPLSLTARTEIFPDAGVMAGLREKDMQQIADWVNETSIGRRTSFDTFKFRSRTDMSMFLLRWNNSDTSNSPWDLF
jgi:hypothetical protein